MKIILSQAVLPESVTKGATYVLMVACFFLQNKTAVLSSYQPPVVKKASRGAKSRNRRRAKKNASDETEGDEGGNDDAMDLVPT